MPPPPHTLPLNRTGTDTHLPEPDEQWKADLRRHIKRTRQADEERLPLPTNAPQNAEGVLFTSLQQQSNGEQGPDESFEDEYGTGGLEDDLDHNPWQSYPPSRPHVPLTQPLHSKSSVSQRNPPSLQRQPQNSQPVEVNDDDEVDDPHGHPPWRHGSQGNQPYSSGGAPRHQSSGSQVPVSRPSSRAPEPSGISHTFAHTNGQVYSTDPTGPVQFPHHGSVNSTGSTSSGAGLHQAGSMNSDQYHSSSVAPHGGAERPPTQNRDRFASNISIAPRLRQISASASPHDRPSPPTYPTAPKSNPVSLPSLDEGVRFSASASPTSRPMYSMQRSPEEMRQGIAVPRGPTAPEEGPQGTSRSSFDDFGIHGRHNSKGEQRLSPVVEETSDVSDDVVSHLNDQQSIRNIRVHSMMDIEQLSELWETEVTRREDEANRKEEEARRKEEEARHLEEKARQSLEEASWLKAEAQRHKAEVQRKEEEVRYREIEVRRKEEQAQRKEGDARKREEILRQKEVDARHREDNIRRREEDAQRREMLARQKEKDARRFEEEAWKKEEAANIIKDDYERKKREIERKEVELKRRMAELLRREPEETTQADASNRAIEDAESTPPEQEKQQKRELEEQLHFEQWLLEERRKQEAHWWEQEEQIRHDEELSRQEQARLNREALLEQDRLVAEAQEREAIRVREEQRRVAEEQRPRVVEEQRRKAEEKSRLRDEQRHQQQQQQDETFRQRAKEEQQREFQRQEAQHYQRTLERDRQNNMSMSSESRATPHQSGSTTGSAGVRSNTSIPASSTWSSRVPPMSGSRHELPVHVSTGARPGAPGTSMARVLKGEDRHGS